MRITTEYMFMKYTMPIGQTCVMSICVNTQEIVYHVQVIEINFELKFRHILIEEIDSWYIHVLEILQLAVHFIH